jgi:flotillin
VHINQSGVGTQAYGRNLENGNVYYQWPTWIPKLGITTIVLPTSIFDIELEAYDAYDKDRLPFTVDVKAFFKVEKAEDAAQRVENFKELRSQLKDILKGSIRSILAGSDIEAILSDRSKFGDEFTKEVSEQLASWGVNTVKNIEFMDIRDSHGSKVIENIMAKKKSEIEMQSRIEVANNQKTAEMAEIDAVRESNIRNEDAQREVGEKEAERKRLVGIADEMAKQEIKEAAKVTAEKDMAVQRVEEEKRAEIDRNVAKIAADKDRDVQIIEAEAQAASAEREKQELSHKAEAELIQEQKKAEGIRAVGDAEASKVRAIGTAEADALKAKELAPIKAQIELAREIGENDGYQQYLLGVEQIKAELEVGVVKAKALIESDIKIIANTGNAQEGFDSLMDVFSAKGGTQLGVVLEGLKNTPIGKELVKKFAPDAVADPENNKKEISPLADMESAEMPPKKQMDNTSKIAVGDDDNFDS